MEFFHRGTFATPPKLSFILLDWSVRESFHTIEYLNHQWVDRADYEIMLLEWHSRRAEPIDRIMAKYEQAGLPAPIDTWAALGRPEDEYYHKHKLYNEGILLASAPVVVIMDSDATVRSTFVSTIIHEFDCDRSEVLHFEQIRNFDKTLYPFNYPLVDEMIGPNCANAHDGIPDGFETCAKSLAEDWNLWHVYNYGACFCARRDDLIAIGGADEHQDYLGHICGPYEMTARLINAGVPDRLHPTHYLYHAYHPSQGGSGNYMGPNDGRGMSLTAMQLPKTGRILPLEENAAIQQRRLEMKAAGQRSLA